MKIDTRFDTAATTLSTSNATDATLSGFQSLLATARQQLDEAISTATDNGLTGSTARKTSKTEDANAAAVKELRDYLNKTPEQRMREAILKEMGLTEEDVAKMPPEERTAVEAAIADKVRERLLAQAQEHVNAASGQLPLSML
ncbi:hypothetical protein VVD49_06955 [Uliginosibacterium sp. H3]|uniref:Uncharacterized protein n=1 Tax=Uliginosibacterium silvisoli TaxID=3114758 RepID=A0ABU6K0J6_9RHOO|nr:hypothetical protein [Uliginosibacterium sp. H3]